MKILTRIAENKKNPERVSLYTEEGFLLSINKELAFQKGLRKGAAIDESLLAHLAAEDDFLKARETAYRMLERSRKTEREIRDRLLDKEYSPATIERVLETLRAYALVDDRTYTDTYLKEKLRSRGRRRAEQELLQKGVAKDMIADALTATELSDVEGDSCMQAARKKHAQLLRRGEEGYRLKGKLYQHLAGKGYGADTIRSTLRTLLEEELSEEL